MNVDYKLLQFQRFLVCCRLYGIQNALKMMLRAGSTGKERTFRLPDGVPFTFRGRVDLGVISHFSIDGYFLEDGPDRPVRTIVDCGANIGDETTRFRLHYPNAQIVAVEPEPGNFEVLQRNLKNFERIRLMCAGVWSSDCHLKIIPSESGNLEAFRVIETTESQDAVRAVTMDSIMKTMAWNEIDILKLDIEGAEHEIFTKNFEQWIDKVNVFVFEAPDGDHPGATQEIYRALGERTFDTYICGENIVLIKRGVPWKFKKVRGLSEKRLRERGLL